MLKSMTAYGQATLAQSIGTLTCEIQSVNRRFLDLKISLPSELRALEPEVQRLISKQVQRGAIQVTVKAAYGERSPLKVEANLPLARELRRAWQEVRIELGIEGQEIPQDLLARVIQVTESKEELDDYAKALSQVIDDALSRFVTMKVEEGKALSKDILERINAIEGSLEAVLENAPDAVGRYREKLRERVQSILSGDEDERILREVALYAEKVDIEEEITRFKSHIEQIKSRVQSPEAAHGKAIEFILQEMLREANTMGSKCPSQDVIDLKIGIEQIREQIQNVE